MTTSPPTTTADQLGHARLVPVLRVADATAAVSAVSTCIAAGVRAVELTATTRGWPEALHFVRASYPDLLVGVGTVTRPADAATALDVGADFLVSPCLVPEVRATLPSDVLLIEGALTATEVRQASRYGPAKLFPAHVGGTTYLRSLLAVLPDARIIPTGGVRVAEVPSWLAAGAFAVGVGTDLFTHGDPAAAVRAALAESPPGG